MKSNRYFNWLTIALLLALITSNAFWLFSSTDTAVTLAYRDQYIEDLDSSLTHAQKLLPAAFASSDRDSFVSAAALLLAEESYDKDGCTWIGRLGFRFDDAGELAHVSRTWSFGAPDPCFPD